MQPSSASEAVVDLTDDIDEQVHWLLSLLNRPSVAHERRFAGILCHCRLCCPASEVWFNSCRCSRRLRPVCLTCIILPRMLWYRQSSRRSNRRSLSITISGIRAPGRRLTPARYWHPTFSEILVHTCELIAKRAQVMTVS